jgi:hypothetical protein
VNNRINKIDEEDEYDEERGHFTKSKEGELSVREKVQRDLSQPEIISDDENV